jgi:hypothetical protein
MEHRVMVHLIPRRDPGQQVMAGKTKQGEDPQEALEVGVGLVRVGQVQPGSRVRVQGEGAKMKMLLWIIQHSTAREMMKWASILFPLLTRTCVSQNSAK